MLILHVILVFPPNLRLHVYSRVAKSGILDMAVFGSDEMSY